VVPDNVDALDWLRKHLDAEASDLLREMVRRFTERLMAAEVEVLCDTGYGEVTPERTTAVTGVGLASWTRGWGRWIVDPEAAGGPPLAGLAARAPPTGRGCVGGDGGRVLRAGLSTWRVEVLVQILGIEHLSKSQVRRMAKERGVQVAAFRSRPLDGGHST
jgi:putative transposase